MATGQAHLHEDRLKRLYLLQELDLSVATIKSGLAILQRSRPYKTQHFLFLLILSTGFERLMKCLLCLHSLDARGKFLTERELRSLGHDVVKLRDEVASECFNTESFKRPAVKEDHEFILHDKLLNAVLEALSAFGLQDRYVYMNGINNPDTTGEWLDRRWEQIEGMTMSQDEGLRLVMENQLDEYKARATRAIMVCLERFLRALARTVTMSGLSRDVQSLGTGVWDFLMKRDEDLGQTEYEIEN